MFWLSSVPTPVGFYARVSGEDQKRGLNIGMQTEAWERYCAAYPEMPTAGHWLDDGVTGTVALSERPGGRAIIAAAQAGKLKTLLVWRIDRLGRDVRDSLNIVFELKRYGIKVLSLTEPYDPETPEGHYMFVVFANNAQLEHATILKRLGEGTNRWAREGAWLGGIVPYGYRVEDHGRERKRLVPDEDPIPGVPGGLSPAAVVRMVFTWLSSDSRYTDETGKERRRSCQWVADHLTALGIPPAYVRDGRKIQRGERTERTAGIWRASRIRNLVVNTTYKGVHSYGKRPGKGQREVITRPCPALVTEEAWDAAQVTLSANLLFSKKNARREYLLRGLIKCGLCGLTYIGTSYPSKKRNAEGKDVPTGEHQVYYTCNGKHGTRGIYGAAGLRCPAKAVRANEIEPAVWEQVEAFLHDPDAILAAIEERQTETTEATEAAVESRAALAGAIRAKEEERQRVISLARRGLISDDDVSRQLAEIENEAEILRRQLSSAHTQQNQQQAATESLSRAQEFLREVQGRFADWPATEAQKRRLIELLVQSITVDTLNPELPAHQREARVTVNYRFGRPPAKNEKEPAASVANHTGIHADSNQGDRASGFRLSLPLKMVRASRRSS